MNPVKINMVAMRGVNDDEIESMVDFAITKGIDVRFIETMPIGLVGIEALEQHISEKDISAKLNKHLGKRLSPINPSKTDGPAHNFKIKGTNSTVGIISAVSNHFCQTCNRVRLTASVANNINNRVKFVLLRFFINGIYNHSLNFIIG
jgi:cyclic pyranopterin phosphate synthase